MGGGSGALDTPENAQVALGFRGVQMLLDRGSVKYVDE